MRKPLVVALIAAFTAFTVPTIASAEVTYNITVPLKLTGLNASLVYQVACALGTTNPANIPPPSSFGGPINPPSSSTPQTVTLTAATPQHSYVCALFNPTPPSNAWGLTAAAAFVSGTM
jgi:hypothetical protein